jgi:hypothetical protein
MAMRNVSALYLDKSKHDAVAIVALDFNCDLTLAARDSLAGAIVAASAASAFSKFLSTVRQNKGGLCRRSRSGLMRNSPTIDQCHAQTFSDIDTLIPTTPRP